MKKQKNRFLNTILFFLIATITLSSCGAQKPKEQPTDSTGDTTEKPEDKKTSDLKIGVVLTTSGKGDKSFNDSAIAGLEKAKADFGITYKDVQPKDVADLEKSIDFLAKEKYNLIFTIGFTSANAIKAIAPKYPDTKFVIIDYSFGEETLPNVKGLVFKEEEGSYLAGALAASLSKNNVIAFVGGMESPLIQKFEVGYKAGALSINPDINVLISYVSADASGFNNPSRAKEISLNAISKNADVIYQASGGSGAGVLEAAAEKNILAIGVDSNQNWLKPGFVVASMLKRVDTAVYGVISKSIDNTLVTGDTEVFDLAVDGVALTDLTELTDEEKNGISPEDQEKIKAAKANITDETKTKIEEIKKGIIEKSIVVPSTR